LEAALAGLQRTSVASEAPSESTSELAAARAQLQRVQGELERATDELARSQQHSAELQQHSAELQQQLEANLMSNSHKSSDAELLRSKLAVADGQVETNKQNRIWRPLGCALHCAACAQHCGRLAGSQRQRAAD
jgi:septal ring factor EnvC (AmiA/AmiB activator)